MTEDSGVCIVIPHYNRVRLLAETLDSIGRQSVQPAEVTSVNGTRVSATVDVIWPNA